MKLHLIFYGGFLLIITIFGSLEWLMYRQGFSFLADKKTLPLFLLPLYTFALANFDTSLLPRSITRFLAYFGGYAVAIFYYSLLFMPLFWLLYLVARFFAEQTFVANTARLIFALSSLITLVGAWTALHPVYREVTVETEKSIKDSTKIVMVSDLHLGSLFGDEYARELVEKINAVSPDIVIMGGDMIDANLNFVVEEGSYLRFKEINAPLGTFAVYGNHDHLMGMGDKEAELFADAGVKIISDAQVIAGDIEITGLNDFSKTRFAGSKLDLSGAGKTNPQLFKIFVEHQPRHLIEAGDAGYDLSFSGHTHAGQFYPNRLVTKKMYALDYGTEKFGNMTAIVSNGYGLWGIPIRVGNTPEVVVVTLKRKGQAN